MSTDSLALERSRSSSTTVSSPSALKLESLVRPSSSLSRNLGLTIWDADDAAPERRLFTGVEGEKDDQGELWGIKVRSSRRSSARSLRT